jgi:hypothetical protein
MKAITPHQRRLRPCKTRFYLGTNAENFANSGLTR